MFRCSSSVSVGNGLLRTAVELEAWPELATVDTALLLALLFATALALTLGLALAFGAGWWLLSED